MLTITDRAFMDRPTIDRRRALPVPIAGIAVALAVWFGGMAGLALAVDPPAVVVFGPERNLLAAVRATDALLLSAGPGFVTARGCPPVAATRSSAPPAGGENRITSSLLQDPVAVP